MNAIRIGLWALVAVVALGMGALAFQTTRDGAPAITGVADIGGPFTLVDQRGETVTRDDILGRPHAVFFGYTFCPDVCPTTLYEMSQHMAAMGDAAPAVVFVSVDPERDTPEVLAKYVAYFDERILALTGSREAVDEAVRAYRAYYRIHPADEDGDILVDHTASVFLFDAEGNFEGTIAYKENPDVAREKLERLVEA